MQIHSFAHKGLERLYTRDDRRGVPARCRAKLANMLAFMDTMLTADELRTPVLRWKAHKLSGKRHGTWALHVTANWRLTFRVDSYDRICDVSLEDYH